MTTRPANRRWPQDIGFFFSIACFSAGVVCTFVLRNHDEPSDSSVVCTIFLLIMVFFYPLRSGQIRGPFQGFQRGRLDGGDDHPGWARSSSDRWNCFTGLLDDHSQKLPRSVRLLRPGLSELECCWTHGNGFSVEIGKNFLPGTYLKSPPPEAAGIPIRLRGIMVDLRRCR